MTVTISSMTMTPILRMQFFSEARDDAVVETFGESRHDTADQLSGDAVVSNPLSLIKPLRDSSPSDVGLTIPSQPIDSLETRKVYLSEGTGSTPPSEPLCRASEAPQGSYPRTCQSTTAVIVNQGGGPRPIPGNSWTRTQRVIAQSRSSEGLRGILSCWTKIRGGSELLLPTMLSRHPKIPG